MPTDGCDVPSVRISLQSLIIVSLFSLSVHSPNVVSIYPPAHISLEVDIGLSSSGLSFQFLSSATRILTNVTYFNKSASNSKLSSLILLSNYLS